MSSRRICLLATISLLTLGACSGPMKLVRVAQAPTTDDKKPKIGKVVDLGAQVLPASGEFKVTDSDGHLSPGEWVAVCGEGLNATSAISLGGAQLPVEGYLKNGLLFRVPRGLDPRQVNHLTVTSGAGIAEAKVKLRTYLAAADRRGEQIRFIRMGPKGLDDKVIAKDFKTMGPLSFSPDGSRIYVLGRSQDKDKDDAREWAKGILKSVVVEPKRVQLPVRVLAMGAKGDPRELGDFEVGLDSEPTRMLSPEPGELLVLSEGHLLWLEVNEAMTPAERGRLDLRGETRRTCFSGIQPVGPGELALLDPCTNGLLRVDMAATGLQIQGAAADLAPNSDLPLTLDMTVEPGQPEWLWVLQGPNFLIPREEMHRGLAKLKDGAMNMLAPLTGKRADSDADPRRTHLVSRLLKIRVADPGLEILSELPLPENFFPTALAALGDGRVAVAGLNGQVFEFANIKVSLEGMKKLLKLLLDTVQLGRVIELQAGAAPVERFKGVALYFQLGRLSGDIPVGVLRPVFQKFPPSVEAQWGVELGSQFVGLRSLDFKSLLPPYVFAPILIQ